MLNSVWQGMRSIWDGIASWVSSKMNWLSDKLTFWRNGQSEMNSGSARGGGAGKYYDGSHADGLAYVPFDGYIAQLHKGERVLTAYENRAYSTGGGDVQNIFHVQAVVREEADIKRIAQELYHLQRNDARGKGVVFV